MKQSIEESAKEYADSLYEPSDRGVLYRKTQRDFIAGGNFVIKAINDYVRSMPFDEKIWDIFSFIKYLDGDKSALQIHYENKLKQREVILRQRGISEELLKLSIISEDK